ncbi:hypothetical protein GmHk_09G025577 [Glycine max]|nr:hypothetical protein GmHk_09G025577 [Glycine max]
MVRELRCDNDMIPSSEEIMFESSSGSKVITISEDTPFDVLRKIINDAIRDELLALLCKLRKPRTTDEIIALMRDESV